MANVTPERSRVDMTLEQWEPPPPQAPQQQTGESTVDWGRYIDALRYRKPLIAGMTVACIVVAAVYTLRQPKLFQAAASIVIETSTPRVLTGVEEVVDVGAGGWVPESFYETEYEVMRSRAVARIAGEKVGILRDEKRNGLAAIVDPTARAAREAELQKTDAADLVLGRFSIDPEKKSSVVRIRVVDADPTFTAQLSNAVAEAYIEQNLDKRIMGTRDASTWLAVQHIDLKKKLESSEDALYEFMAQKDVLNASLESQLDEVRQRVQAFNAQLANEQAESIREQTNAKALAQVIENPALVRTLEPIQNAPVISSLKQALEDLRTEEEKLSTRYQPTHPRMDELHKQIASLEARLKVETDAVLAAMRRRQESLGGSIAGLKTQLLSEREREARLNKLALEYARLKREVDTNAKLYDMVTSRMKEADITSALPFNNVRILDRAQVPERPFKPNLQYNLLAGLVVGLLLGIGLAVLLDIVDNTVKSQEDVENLLAVPFLGLMPLIDMPAKKRGNRVEQMQATHSRDLYVVHEPKSTAAECARFIRTNLLFMSPDRPLRTVVVTSPAPQEGKTTTAVNIAVTMAQAGSRTLLVDTDMRRPRIHRVFDIENDVGLSSVIVGEQTLEKAVHRTEVENLDVLACGPLPPNPAEILHTDRFRTVMREMTTRYDRVIFDTPPVGPVTDPVILGAQVDGTVLVVKCEKTTRDMATQALRALTDAKARVLGVILNDVDVTAKRYSRVYYSYYRRYGTYYGNGKGPQSTDKPGKAA